jgi:hypothetical protein
VEPDETASGDSPSDIEQKSCGLFPLGRMTLKLQKSGVQQRNYLVKSEVVMYFLFD